MDDLPLEGTGRMVGCLGTVIGILAVSVGMMLVGHRAYELSQMQHTTGIAVKYERGMKGSGPHVRFQADGENYVADAYAYADSVFESGVSKGDSVGVYYWSKAPSKAKVDLFAELWFGRLLTLGVGCGFFVIGQILYWTNRPLLPKR